MSLSFMNFSFGRLLICYQCMPRVSQLFLYLYILKRRKSSGILIVYSIFFGECGHLHACPSDRLLGCPRDGLAAGSGRELFLGSRVRGRGSSDC